MLLEAMGLHVPGAAFIHPHDGLREDLTREAVRLVVQNTQKQNFTPIGMLVDERVIVNAMVALLATSGSTNHLIHWVAVARSAGIIIDWTDFHYLAKATPLLTMIYPNGTGDVNEFQTAGGPGFVIRELIKDGCMFPDVFTVAKGSLHEYGKKPSKQGGKLIWNTLPEESGDETIVRRVGFPFNESGGLRLLKGNLGRSVIKISSAPENRHILEAPAIIFYS